MNDFTCPYCRGEGRGGERDRTCPRCMGSGAVPSVKCDGCDSLAEFQDSSGDPWCSIECRVDAMTRDELEQAVIDLLDVVRDHHLYYGCDHKTWRKKNADCCGCRAKQLLAEFGVDEDTKLEASA